MDIERARFLVSAAGQESLTAHASLSVADPVKLGAALRRALPPFEAAAIAEQLTLRERARERFGPAAEGLLLTEAGLQMMTHPAVAERRAHRLCDDAVAADLTCGLGGDLRFLAATGASTVGVEREPVTALLAAHNVSAAPVIVGDALAPPLRLAAAHILLDPSRRSDRRRTFDPAAFSPPWDACIEVARAAGRAVVKGPPGIARAAVPPDAELEFVQVGRGLREAALWFGDGARPGLRRAVLLIHGAEIDSTAEQCPPEPVTPGAVLFDPESCVTRAGLVRHLGNALGARLIDEQVAYLTASDARTHPLAAAFAVLGAVPFGVARLREALRKNRWRPSEVRRRAFPVEPGELLRLIGPIEGEPVTLLCTTVAGSRTVFVTRPVAAEEIAQPCRQ